MEQQLTVKNDLQWLELVIQMEQWYNDYKKLKQY